MAGTFRLIQQSRMKLLKTILFGFGPFRLKSWILLKCTILAECFSKKKKKGVCYALIEQFREGDRLTAGEEKKEEEEKGEMERERKSGVPVPGMYVLVFIFFSSLLLSSFSPLLFFPPFLLLSLPVSVVSTISIERKGSLPFGLL